MSEDAKATGDVKAGLSSGRGGGKVGGKRPQSGARWGNRFISFSLVPVDQGAWAERVSSVLPPMASFWDRKVMAAVVLEALIQPPRVWTHYSRNTSGTKGSPRPHFLLHNPDATGAACEIGYGADTGFTIRRIIRVVDHLADHGLLYSHRVKPHAPDRDRWSYSSSFMAESLLRAKLSVPPLMRRPDDVIRLRDEYGRRKMLPDTPEVRFMRQRREAHNALMASVEIALPGAPFDGVRYRVSAGVEAWDVYPTPMFGHRVFNETFERGGRIYGFWPQQLPMRDAPVRRALTINGEPTVEMDYNAHHIRILYAKAGVEPPADPYDIPGVERKHAKIATLVAINAGTARGAAQAIADDLSISRKEASPLVQTLKAKNQPIAEFFHSDVGVELQRADSDIMEAAVSLLTERGVPCIPVHDSLICTASRQGLLQDAMVAAWRGRFPEAECRVDVK